MASLECLPAMTTCSGHRRGGADCRQPKSAFLPRPHLSNPQLLDPRQLGREQGIARAGIRAGCRSRLKNSAHFLKNSYRTRSARWNGREQSSSRLPIFSPKSAENLGVLHTEVVMRLPPPSEITKIFDFHDFLSNIFNDANTIELLSFALGATVLASTAAYVLRRGNSVPAFEVEIQQISRPIGANASSAVSECTPIGATKEWLNLSSSSPFYRAVSARCPSLYTSPGNYFPKRTVQKPKFQRRCVPTGDGGTVALDWPSHLEMDRAEELDNVVLLVCGTAEGSAEDGIGKFSLLLEERGYFPIILNPRGCGGSPLTTPRVFSAADGGDVRLAADFIAKSRPAATIFGVGWGLGASILVRYLGEEKSSTPLTAAVCVDIPFDLLEASHAETGSRWSVSDRSMVKGLVRVVESNKLLFEGETKGFNIDRALAAASGRDFDNAVSRIVHGYENVDEFYVDNSSGASIEKVRVPLLCIQHADDYAGKKMSYPRRPFETNACTMLLVSAPSISGEDHPGAASEWTHLISLEWLAAVEVSLLKGRQPLDAHGEVGIKQSDYTSVAKDPKTSSTSPTHSSGNFNREEDSSASIYARRSRSPESSPSHLAEIRSSDRAEEGQTLRQKGTEERTTESVQNGAVTVKAANTENGPVPTSAPTTEIIGASEQSGLIDESPNEHRKARDAQKEATRRQDTAAFKAPDVGNGAVGSTVPDTKTLNGSKRSSREGNKQELEQQSKAKENETSSKRNGAPPSKSSHGEGSPGEEGRKSEQQPAAVEPPSPEETGQLLQVTEGVMKVLDMTMPGALKDAQKKQVLQAVGRGENLVAALEEAVPEDVRGKISGAVSEVVQDKNFNSKLEAFGKMPGPPAGLVAGIEAEFAAVTAKKDVSNVAQEIPKPKSVDDGSNGSLSTTNNSTKTDAVNADAKSSNGANAQDTSSSQGAKGPDQAQSVADKAAGGSTKTDPAPTPPTNDGSQTPQNGAAPSTKTTADATASTPASSQTPPSDSASPQGEKKPGQAQGSADKAASGATKSDPAATSPNQDGSQAPQNGAAPSAKPSADAATSPPDSPQAPASDSSAAAPPPPAADKSTNPQPAAQSATPAPAPSSAPEDGKTPPTAQTTPPPTSPPQNASPPPAPASPAPTPPPPSTAPQLPSIGEALQALTGFDDATQMAVTNVFGVAENMLDQMEEKSTSKPDDSEAAKDAVRKVHEGMARTLELPSSGQSESKDEGGKQRDASAEPASVHDDETPGEVDSTNADGQHGASAENGKGKSRLKAKQPQPKAEQKGSEVNASPSQNGGAKTSLHRTERGYIKSEEQIFSEKGPGEHQHTRQASSASDERDSVEAEKSAPAEAADSNASSESANENRLTAMEAEIDANNETESSAVDQASPKDDGKAEQKGNSSSVVTSLIMNALQLEVVRRLGGAGLETLGVDLGREVEKVAGAVSEAASTSQSRVLGQLSSTFKAADGEDLGDNKGVLDENVVLTALNSVLGHDSLLGGLIPIGILAGVVLAALGTVFLIVSDDHEEESAQVRKGSATRKLAADSENSGEVSSQGEKSDAPQDDEGKMMGAVASAVCATTAVASQGNTTTTGLEGHGEDKGMPDLAAKAVSIVSPVVPKTETGEVDQERVVAVLTEIGQRGGPLILVGKAALLWGGVRGAMSLVDRLLSFLRMSERPLAQRLLGFCGMTILLWTPVLLPLLPTLLQHWATGSPNGIADAAAGLGLYGAVFILVTIWGRRVRGYERPLVAYGLEMFSRAKLRLFAGGIAIGLSLVSFYYGINWGLGYANVTWESLVPVVENPALPGALASAAFTSWKLLTMVGQSLSVAGAVALVEEVLFRAWLQEEIAVDLGYDWAILTSAFAFAVVHWSSQAIVGLWFLAVAFSGGRARMDGHLTLPVGIHTGILTAFSVVNTSGLVRFVPDAPAWFTGAHVGNPLAGALGTGMAAALAIALYPRHPLSVPGDDDYFTKDKSFPEE